MSDLATVYERGPLTLLDFRKVKGMTYDFELIFKLGTADEFVLDGWQSNSSPECDEYKELVEWVKEKGPTQRS